MTQALIDQVYRILKKVSFGNLSKELASELISIIRPVQVITVGTNYTVTSDDFEILADSSTGPLTIFLPPATASGLMIHVGKIGGTDDVVTVLADGNDTIQGSNQIALVDNFSDCWLIDAATGYWDNPSSSA